MIPDPTKLDVAEKDLLVLDDCFLGPQRKAESYYTRGRHKNCDTFYISQNYFRLPRHCDDDMSLQEFKNYTAEKCGAKQITILSPLTRRVVS